MLSLRRGLCASGRRRWRRRTMGRASAALFSRRSGWQPSDYWGFHRPPLRSVSSWSRQSGFWPISTIPKRRNRWGCVRTAMHRMPRPRPYRCRRRLSRCRAPGSGGTGACLRLRRAWRLACSRRSGFWRTFSPFWCQRLTRNWRDLPLAALRPLRYWAGPWSAG